MRHMHTLLMAALISCETLCLSAQTNRQAALPDSLLTVKKAEQLQFTDRALAKRIISEIRKRKLASDYDTDLAEATILYNSMEFRQALDIYSRLLDSREAKNSAEKTMDLLSSLCDTHDALHHTTEKLAYIKRLHSVARQNNNKYYESLALFQLGKTLYYDGDHAKGITNVRQAISLMAKSSNPNREHQLHSQLNVLATMYTDDQHFDEALQAMERNEQVLRSEKPANTDDLMVLLSKKASLLAKMGRNAEADSVYGAWKALPKNPDNKRTYFIIDYLRNRGLYDKAMEVYEMRLVQMRQRGDTMNLMTYIMKWGMAETAYNLHRYQQAADLYLDVVNIGDTLQRQAAKSKAQEIEAIYQTQEKEREIAKQRLWLLMLTSVIVLFLLGAAVWARYTHIIRQKNRAMVKTIDELMRYRSLVQQKQHQQHDVRQIPETEGSNDAQDKSKADKSTTPQPVREEAGAGQQCQGSLQNMFLSFDSKVVSQRLFCSPDFDREQLIRVSGIDKNRLATIIRQFSGTNIPGYINSKRVEHAVSLMKEHPEFTLVAIAESCGFTNQTTFIRAFKNIFGMTPSEYRQAQLLPPPRYEC